MDSGVPPGPSRQRLAAAGRIPLAVVVVDGDGLVSHWSTGARRLFGHSKDEAVGQPATDLMPVAGALAAEERGVAHGTYDTEDGGGPELHGRGSYATAGCAALSERGRDRLDVVWWAYPLIGPGPGRHLVLAADAAQFKGDDVDGRADTRRISPAFALHTEFPDAEVLARRLPDILPNMGPAESSRIVAQVLELGYPVLEFSHHDRVPVTPDWGVPRRPAGRGGLTDPVDEDGNPRRRAAPRPELDLEYAAVRERLEFLNEVSGRIGSSLDLARTIREVTSAAVPRFTDFAGTHLRAAVLAGEGFPDGPPDVTTVWHRVWVEHNDEPGRWDDTVPVGEAIAFPEHTPFFQCMVTGEPVLIPRLSEEAGDRISAEFEKRDLRPLINHRSMLLVPLKARDVVLGFMVLMRRPDRQPFDDMDRTTGAELAARAGLVLDNARMYTYQENVAETLQDSMLPQVPPHMAGCDIATRYLPGARLGRIGGDWFDAVKLPGSRTALVVGDVMGHGLNSAAMMGQLRTAVQTMATMEMPPAQLLRNLDDLAQRLGELYLATCLYAVYDPIRSELQIANAGHIPPVLVHAEDGRAEVLDLPTGAPIGVGGVAFETATVKVGPGDRLVLCTDGLVEVRGADIGDGLAALCASAAHPAASMDHACDTIIRALNTREGRKDDVALLMARLNGIPDRDVAEFHLALDPREVARARRLVRGQLLDWELPAAVETAQLMVSELVTNAVKHARSRRVGLRLVRTDALLCEVIDDEPAPAALLNAGRDDEFGRGLRVVSTLAREWGSSSSAGGKTVWFEQALARKVRARSNGS
ncbi:SpoIIE family protein phosphatase [Streptomyces scopuliridis]|uniref:SpoIIE family protein phosphatase n=1 Tax=Streptomyces scopuliridis TaxID=452529 RepID=A0ACD4ZFU1_9ACTN|nr:SpoIIE family protein phosphatase [Streptomyces scopuliridis]WSB96881.1 SpoIIE family protein phosphatase [Streptomyces scopuliridis]WSC09415.1 SpoIIE family protein phosphatase [Streptomyces scopuliridis]